MNNQLLEKMRNNEAFSFSQEIQLIIQLSIPAILAQLSSVAMQYIDAAMVGRLGSNASASIGLISSSTWLLSGLCSAFTVGFQVLVAHRIGAHKDDEAKNLVKEGLILSFAFGIFLSIIAIMIHNHIPLWLGGNEAIITQSAQYFLIYGISLMFLPLYQCSSGMIQCSGNMKLPSMVAILMCLLDVIFNFILIFPTNTYHIFGLSITIFGANLNVIGAALGTMLATLCCCIIMLYVLLVKSSLKYEKGFKYHFNFEDIKEALKLSLPVGLEQVILCGAYIAATKIVAPLGTIAIAANSFAVTAESIAYMPGYGISSAATTLIGQSVGSNRKDLSKHLSWIILFFGMIVMLVGGVLLFMIAPFMMSLLTSHGEVQRLSVEILRIELISEPLYGASIICGGIFRGSKNTLLASAINLISMWLIRIPLSIVLAQSYGLHGVWLAMCIELCARGLLSILCLYIKGKWNKW